VCDGRHPRRPDLPDDVGAQAKMKNHKSKAQWDLPYNFPPINRISMMTSVPRLIKFWESMSTQSNCSVRVNTLAVPKVLALPPPCPRRGGTLDVRVLNMDDREGSEVSGHLSGLGGPVPLVSGGAVEKVPVVPPDDTLRLAACNENSEVLREFPTTLMNELADVTQPDIVDSNPYTVLEAMDDGCARCRALCGRAKTLVQWYRGFGLNQIRDPPATIKCGELRQAVRQCFPDVDPVWELSFKTISKIERSCCKLCLPRFQSRLRDWKEARIRPQPIDEEHLRRFRSALRANVEKGWDSNRRPFIPNGNATRSFKRKDGGNWNKEEFSEDFRTELVFSSGKPRVVTVYSSENTRILGPLHYSLYDHLKRRRWLLVGEPTDSHVQDLNGAELLSFDYSSATDNIKTRYVRAAIDVLKEQANELSEDEIAALDVLGGLSLDGVGCGSGQPMGSIMSFPLLCLINKTVVDLGMNRLLEEGRISFREWSRHRCLINGDDLLVREVRKTTSLRTLISEEGSQVGLVVNQEKTMSSHSLCEINSTLFDNGVKVRKFNASAVWMDPGVEDVLGFAAEATPTVQAFRKVVRQNANILAKSKDKHLAELPPHLRTVCRKDKKIRRALTSLPVSERQEENGVIKMAPVPDGYDLVPAEEHRAMAEEIERLREVGVAWAKARALRKKFRTTAIPDQRSYSAVLKRKQTADKELIPACYCRAYVNKMKDALIREEVAPFPAEQLPPGDGSTASIILDNLRLFKQKRAVRPPVKEEFASNSDFIGFD